MGFPVIYIDIAKAAKPSMSSRFAIWSSGVNGGW